MLHRKLIITLTCLCFFFKGYAQKVQPSMVLWYRQPANFSDSLPYKNGSTTNPFDDRNGKGWVEALPIGNGRMGAMVFGGIETERLQLNEESLWAGYYHDVNNPEAYAALPLVRRLIFEGKEDSAKLIGEKAMLGIPKRVSPYQSMGDLLMVFPGLVKEQTRNYYRSLDVDHAMATVRFEQGNNKFTREAFASHVDDVIVLRLTASQKGSLSINLSLDREKDAGSMVKNNSVILSGRLNVPDEKGINHGMLFATHVLPICKGGIITSKENKLIVTNADEIILLIAQATGFGGRDPQQSCAAALLAASKKSYDVLKGNHILDYQKLYGRVKINLNNIPDKEAFAVPTDKRIERLKTDSSGDDYLSALQYQYSRYLMISCSRPGDLPANLQGLWNQHMKPAWESDYHTNINLQMNYWFVEAANLAECHKPLITYIDTLAYHGKRTAKVHYGANGWVVHHASDLFGYTAPVAGVHGVWPVGGAWLARHSFEHYLYSGNTTFLRDKAYPHLRGAAAFMLDFLMEVPPGLPFAGKLVTNPSHSPENAFERPDGTQSQFTSGATMDIQITRDLFDNYLEALDVLQKSQPGLDREFQSSIVKAREHLLPLQVNSSGRIQEWIEDYKETELGHRHISHVYGLYPDNQISVSKTPEMAKAALQTLSVRLQGNPDQPKTKFGAFDSYLNGKKGTGWGRAWIALCFARLGLGDEAYKHHLYLQSQFVFPNLFGIAHGTYQIDNVFGNAAAINEMLLQSQESFIHLLPAMPSKWKDGFANGLRAIGGFQVDMTWQDTTITVATIESTIGGLCKVKAGKIIRR
ncbi:MAG: glycoside hydrolase family 95 protein [Chitinophagaceae bacterium]